MMKEHSALVGLGVQVIVFVGVSVLVGALVGVLVFVGIFVGVSVKVLVGVASGGAVVCTTVLREMGVSPSSLKRYANKAINIKTRNVPATHQKSLDFFCISLEPHSPQKRALDGLR